jgi:hypothetical protein
MEKDPIDAVLIASSIEEQGWARLPLLDPVSCNALAAHYDEDRHFRSTVVMRWSPCAGQFGGFAKLGSGSFQAANLAVSFCPGPIAA